MRVKKTPQYNHVLESGKVCGIDGTTVYIYMRHYCEISTVSGEGMAKTQRVPYVYRSFSCKRPYNWWVCCGKRHEIQGILCIFATLYIYTHIYIYIYLSLSLSLSLSIYVHICTYIYICILINTHIHIQIHRLDTFCKCTLTNDFTYIS